MKQIIFTIAILVSIKAQSQFIQKRKAFIATDSISSPVYHKKSDTLASASEIKNMYGAAYGSLYFSATTTDGTLGTEAVTNSNSLWIFKKIDNSNIYSGSALLTTLSPTNGTITISNGGAGKYLVTYSLSFNTDLSNGFASALGVLVDSTPKLESLIFDNGTSTNYSYFRTMSGSCILTLSDNDVLSLAIALISSNNGQIVVKSMNLSIVRISK